MLFAGTNDITNKVPQKKCFLQFNFAITKICVVIRLAEDGIMIARGTDVSSSHKEYQNILKDYVQNLVICSYIGVEITSNFV